MRGEEILVSHLHACFPELEDGQVIIAGEGLQKLPNYNYYFVVRSIDNENIGIDEAYIKESGTHKQHITQKTLETVMVSVFFRKDTDDRRDFYNASHVQILENLKLCTRLNTLDQEVGKYMIGLYESSFTNKSFQDEKGFIIPRFDIILSVKYAYHSSLIATDLDFSMDFLNNNLYN